MPAHLIHSQACGDTIGIVTLELLALLLCLALFSVASEGGRHDQHLDVPRSVVRRSARMLWNPSAALISSRVCGSGNASCILGGSVELRFILQAIGTLPMIRLGQSDALALRLNQGTQCAGERIRRVR